MTYLASARCLCDPCDSSAAEGERTTVHNARCSPVASLPVHGVRCTITAAGSLPARALNGPARRASSDAPLMQSVAQFFFSFSSSFRELQAGLSRPPLVRVRALYLVLDLSSRRRRRFGVCESSRKLGDDSNEQKSWRDFDRTRPAPDVRPSGNLNVQPESIFTRVSDGVQVAVAVVRYCCCCSAAGSRTAEQK